MSNYCIEPGSFRDRNGRVFYGEDKVYRGLSPHALAQWELLSAAPFFNEFMKKGRIVATEMVTMGSAHLPAEIQAERHAAYLRHDRIPFISYPYEWSFGMLKDAAMLQLELLLHALDEGMILKDASAFNFQWVGAKPVFIDIPSFEKLQSGEPWIGYRQFCQLFLYPLFLQAYKDVPFHPWLRGDIDGIEPDQVNRIMSLRDVFKPGVLNHVVLHSKIQSRYESTTRDIKQELNSAGFSKTLIRHNVRKLLTIIQNLKWKRSSSEWSGYTDTHSYDTDDFAEKVDFVRDVVHSGPAWKMVWDLGSNTGTFSKIAAENASYVVAMDADHLTIERLYLDLRRNDDGNILPLVMNMNAPSPNQGWRGMERKSLENRGTPNLTLCLALIHHIVISANIPLKAFIEWLASLNTHLIIEFVSKSDPMVQKLLKNKVDQYDDYDLSNFEVCLRHNFRLIRKKELHSGTRFLFYAGIPA